MRAVRWSIAALATSLGLVLGPGQASAQASPGDLDPTFGTGGKVTTDFVGGHDQARALVVTADGRLVAAGLATGEATNLDFALARYNPDGSLDPSFGNGGEVTTDFGGFPPDDHAHSLVQQADGKLVVAGGVFRSDGDFDNDFALARYNPDGSLDASFGNGGIVLTDFADGEEAHALALQADGKLVAAGVAFTSGAGQMFGLARYNPDGSLDASFGNGGTVTTAFGSGIVQPSGLAVQADGKLVAAGSVLVGSTLDFALVRYQPNGTLDQTFGKAGRVTTQITRSDDDAQALALQADGKLVLAGSANVGGHFDFALARYRPNGTLDRTFGKAGKVTTDFTGPDNSDAANALAVQADGKLVAAGVAFTGGVGEDFALARYQRDGSLDPAFGTGGKVTTDFAGSTAFESVNALAVQADGNLVAAGVAQVAAGAQPDFALARYAAR
jgi:uncharacterized delta-60 repeat protein